MILPLLYGGIVGLSLGLTGGGGSIFAALTGVLSGIFGIGGGFLVVPALMVVTGIGIEQALATSLVGIFLIAGSGFAANAHQLAAGDVGLGLLFLLGSGAGMTVGGGSQDEYTCRLVKTHLRPHGAWCGRLPDR